MIASWDADIPPPPVVIVTPHDQMDCKGVKDVCCVLWLGLALLISLVMVFAPVCPEIV